MLTLLVCTPFASVKGMSYGMMVQVQMNNQTAFDRIWRWVLTHMYHAKETDPLHGWSAWHATTAGVPIDQVPKKNPNLTH